MKAKEFIFSDRTVTLTEIQFTMDTDPTVQRGLLVHDSTDDHSDGDAIFPFECIETKEDLDMMYHDSFGMTDFELTDGVYRCHY